ncbi:MAG: tetratricopeptide repeat protein, partial [Pseudomonadota bacterium]
LAQMLLSNWFDNTAEALERTGRYAAEALSIDPQNVAALTAMGAYELFSFEFEAAEAHFQRALAVNPNSVDAANWYGDFLLIVHRLDEALVWETLAARLDPLLAVHQLNIGFVHSQAGNIEGAVSAYRAALEIDPGFANALINLTRILVTERDFEALQALDHAYDGPLRKNLDDVMAFARLIEDGELEAAEAMVSDMPADTTKVLALRMLHQDQSPAAWDLLAAIHEQQTKAGYPTYLWPDTTPTFPAILAQSEAYAAFWRTPPRDRVLKLRGHWIPAQQ